MEFDGDLQDGMLAHYQEQAKSADVNVEARIAREPFDFREMSRKSLLRFLRDNGVAVWFPVSTAELRAAAANVKEGGS